jgi:hypothetical protein
MPETDDNVVLSEEIVGELSEDDPVERAVFYSLDEAAQKLEEQGDFDPMLIIVQGEEIHVDEPDGDDEETIIAAAQKTVYQMAKVADAYVFVYDGFVDLDDDSSDAIIVEYARKGDSEAQVLAWLYAGHDDHLHFSEPLYSLGNAPSMFDVPDEEKSADGDAGGAGDEAGDAATAASDAAAAAAAAAADPADADSPATAG